MSLTHRLRASATARPSMREVAPSQGRGRVRPAIEGPKNTDAEASARRMRELTTGRVYDPSVLVEGRGDISEAALLRALSSKEAANDALIALFSLARVED